LTYDYLKTLKTTHQTLRLLCSDNFAMSVSFFHAVFVVARQTTMTQSELVRHLEDYLFTLNERQSGAFPKMAQEYLNDFANSGYLRKYYADADEPLYDLTPQTQKALEWIESLQKREFVGSRSRFNLIFDLLEELAFETELDDETRIAKLEEQKRELDAQIEAIRSKTALRFDESRIKEQYMQIEEIARNLRYDFAEIEYNFRDLNTRAMETIAMREDAKAEVLGSIFAIEDEIRDSDQGRSFFAFWQLLTDMERSARLSEMVEKLYALESVNRFDPQRRLKNLKYELLGSGEKIVTVTGRLIEQLRRFIDDRVWIENRRILELCRGIEKQALKLKDTLPKSRRFMALPGAKVVMHSIADKRLYRLRTETVFTPRIEPKTHEIDLEGFLHQCYVDEAELTRRIETLLLQRPQCTLGEVVAHFGADKGVAELIGYFSIAKQRTTARIDHTRQEWIEVRDFDGNTKTVRTPMTLFTRG
jgi:hypothetical protein